jgi:hypothetical protein
MEPEFITYQKFDDPALAEMLTDLLEENDIAYEVEEQEFLFDPSLVLSNAKKEYAVKIRSEDFDRVTQLLQANETENIEGVEQDYYLFGFTDEELMEVITKADEWSAFDVVLARKILADRGKAISDAEVDKIHEERIEELRQPDPPQTLWITIGYMAAFLGGIFGIFVGWHIYTFKKTLPDGERVYGYNEHDRRQGKIILWLSGIIFAVAVVVRFVLEFRGINSY